MVPFWAVLQVKPSAVRVSGYGNVMTMRTAHLELVPFSHEYLLALVEGDERFEKCFGLPVAEFIR